MRDTRKVNPAALLFFFKSIQERLNKQSFDWDDKDIVSTTVVVLTKEFMDYSYPTIQLVEKHLSKKGWECKMVNYTRGIPATYSWRFRKKGV